MKKAILAILMALLVAGAVFAAEPFVAHEVDLVTTVQTIVPEDSSKTPVYAADDFRLDMTYVTDVKTSESKLPGSGGRLDGVADLTGTTAADAGTDVYSSVTFNLYGRAHVASHTPINVSVTATAFERPDGSPDAGTYSDSVPVTVTPQEFNSAGPFTVTDTDPSDDVIKVTAGLREPWLTAVKLASFKVDWEKDSTLVAGTYTSTITITTSSAG